MSGQHRRAGVLNDATARDVDRCAMCGQPKCDHHNDEGPCERLLSLLKDRSWQHPKACIALLRLLSRPDLSKSEVARLSRITPAAMLMRLHRLGAHSGIDKAHPT